MVRISVFVKRLSYDLLFRLGPAGSRALWRSAALARINRIWIVTAPRFVIPAQAGIRKAIKPWMLAFASMTAAGQRAASPS